MPKKNATTENKKELNEKTIYSRPIIKREFKLYTHETQVIFMHTAKKINQLFYSLNVVYPLKFRDQELFMEQKNSIEDKFNKISQQIQNEIKLKEKLLAEHKLLDCKPEYSKPLLLEIKLMTPTMNRYIDLLLELDSLIIKNDCCWLNALIDTEVRSKTNYSWEKLVFQFFSLLITTCNELAQVLTTQATDNSNSDQA